jgi:hypothetical protein
LLPIPTLTLVAVRVVYSSTAIAALSLVVHVTLAIVIGGPRDPWWFYPVAAVSTMAVVQTLGLAAGCLGDWSLGVLFASWLVIAPSLDELLTETSIMESAPIPFAFTAIVVFASILISTGVVHLRRTGRWDPELLIAWRGGTATRNTDRVLPPFDSAFAAQRWFEMRRMRNYFWITLVSSTVVVSTMNVIPRISTERFLEDYSTAERLYWGVGQSGMLLPFMFIVSALFTGVVMLLQNIRLHSGPMSAFLFLRPMSTAHLARARLRGTLNGLRTPFLVTTTLTVIFCATWGLIDEPNPLSHLTNRYSDLQILAITLILAVGVAAAAWAVYWTALICLGAAGFMFYSIAFYWIFEIVTDSETTYVSVDWLLISFLLCIAALTSTLMAIAIRRDLLSGWRAIASVIVAVSVTAAFWFATYWDDIWSAHDVDWDPSLWPRYTLLMLLLVAPIPTIPLTLHWARHR